MEAFKDLFTFPIILVDGENEERKKRTSEVLGNDDNRQEYDVVTGQAQFPYYDFRGVEDRWLPTDESFQKALDGKFEACLVTFLHTPQALVPWSKEKFKAKIAEFFSEREKEIVKEETESKQIVTQIQLTEEQVKQITKILQQGGENGNKPQE